MKLNHITLYLFLLFIFTTLTLEAQTIFIGAGSGGGTFEMKSAKEFNQVTIKQLPFQPVLKDNFPPWFFYKAEVIYCLPRNLSVGINVSTTSTGSRLTLADYSGKYTLDDIQKGFFPGIKVLYGTGSGYLSGFHLSLEGGLAISKMVVKEELKVNEESQINNGELNALGYYVQPGVCYFMNLTPRFILAANISYYLGFEKGYHPPKAKDQFYYFQDSGKPLKPQWDGIRLGITAYWKWPNKLEK